MLKNKRGQSTLEYILLVTGVITVLLVFLSPTGGFFQMFNKTLNQVTSSMANMAVRYSNSIPKQ